MNALAAERLAGSGLRHGAVGLCLVALEQLEPWRDAFGAWLDAEEAARYARFAFASDRDRYLLSHGLLRGWLSALAGIDAAAIEFVKGVDGKPALFRAGQPALHFNLSHSGRRVMLALARDREVGVDVEVIKPGIAGEGIAERWFTAREAASVRAAPATARDALFTRCWVRKEAVLKGWGTGLTLPLETLDVGAEDDTPKHVLAPRDAGSNRSPLWLVDVEVDESYCAALACAGAPASVVGLAWPPQGLRHAS